MWWRSSGRSISSWGKSTGETARKEDRKGRWRDRSLMQPASQATLEFLKLYWAPLLCGLAVVAVLPLIAGYVVLVERKIMADMQARLGPMRVGPHGLLQPIADAVKLLIKEDVIPDNADKFIFWFAPVLSVTAALTSMGAIAFVPWFQVARDINI